MELKQTLSPNTKITIPVTITLKDLFQLKDSTTSIKSVATKKTETKAKSKKLPKIKVIEKKDRNISPYQWSKELKEQFIKDYGAEGASKKEVREKYGFRSAPAASNCFKMFKTELNIK